MLLEVFFVIIGFILLIKGADFLVDGASNFAKKLHIPEIVIGLTIVSIGTSMPELFVSITSALDGYSDISVGNIIGSNIANLLLILGVSATIRPISFKRETIKYEIQICLGITLLFYILANSDNTINQTESLILIFFFILFVIYTIVLAKKKKDNIEDIKTNTSYFLDIVFMILGGVCLKFGGDFVVDNAVKIAHTLKISEKVISITVLALGTSLPELVTSIHAARKGQSDLAIGNIIGSNIFNILLIIGVSAFIKPIAYNPSYNRDLIIFFSALIILKVFAHTKPKEKMSRLNGIFYFGLYIIYIMLLFL